MSEAGRRFSEAATFGRLDPARASALLAALGAAHDELGKALTALDELTGAECPDPARYAHARWQLSSARRKRRAAAAEAHAALLAVAGPSEAAAIARLRSEDDLRLRDSALHVQHWTNDRIAADWLDYRAAAAALRAASRDSMAAERALLVPMLERFARVG